MLGNAPMPLLCDEELQTHPSTAPSGDVHGSFAIAHGEQSDVATVPFSLNEREDADFLNRLILEESSTDLNPDFLDAIQKGRIDKYMRCELTDWLSDITEQFQFESCETYALSISFIDRFCSLVPVSPQQYQLLGGACLLLAAKLKETHVPTCHEICSTADYSFNEQDLQTMEKLVLGKLRWRLNTITPSLLVYYFLPFFGNGHQLSAVAVYASRLLNMIYSDYDFLKYPPSIQALAAFKNSFRYNGFPDSMFSEGLAKILSILQDGGELRAMFINVCANRMHAATIDIIPIPILENCNRTQQDSAHGVDSHLSSSALERTALSAAGSERLLAAQNQNTPSAPGRVPTVPAKRQNTPPNVMDSAALFMA